MLRRAGSSGSGGWRGDDAVGACTESLGSESGDVGGDAEIDHQLGLGQPAADDDDQDEEEEGEEEARPTEPRRAVASPEKRPRRLPPPMPRAAEGRAFVSMRAERRGGRLILTEQVRVDRRRREVFRASRDGGRLRLQFAADGGAAEQLVGGGCCCSDDAGEFCLQVAASRLVR